MYYLEKFMKSGSVEIIQNAVSCTSLLKLKYGNKNVHLALNLCMAIRMGTGCLFSIILFLLPVVSTEPLL